MDWLRTTIAGRSFLELVFIVALGFALWTLAGTVADVVVSALAQAVNESDVAAFGPYGLTFEVGNTVVDYGRPLSVLVAIFLLVAGFAGAAKLRDRRAR